MQAISILHWNWHGMFWDDKDANFVILTHIIHLIVFSARLRNYYDTVIAQKNEIFILFRTMLAISGHGCPEKPEMSMEAHRGRLRNRKINFTEHIENPFFVADNVIIVA